MTPMPCKRSRVLATARRMRVAPFIAAVVAAVLLPGAPPSASAPAPIGGARGAPAEQAAVALSAPCAERTPRLRCPDLIMSAPSHLHFDGSTIRGRVLLRATSSIDNHGRGPLELRAHRRGSGHFVVYQAIYDRRGRAHLFRTSARLDFKYVPGERYGYGNVGAVSYWKFRHAAAFELWSIDAHDRALRLVRRGPKLDYCLRDLVRTRPSLRSPARAVYPGCRESRRIRNDVLGTSVGWSDVYPYEYPQQWIDVTGLRGRFAYVQRADPDGLLVESSHANDVSEVYISLPSGRVLGRRVGVSRP
jgi:hypothetical protein